MRIVSPGFSRPRVKTLSIDGEIGLRNSGGFDEAQTARHRQAQSDIGKRIFGIAAGADKGANLRARVERRYALPERDDTPGNLQPRHVGFTGRRRIASLALKTIRSVDAGGDHFDQNLTRPRHRNRRRAQADHFRTAGAVEKNFPHGFRRRQDLYSKICTFEHLLLARVKSPEREEDAQNRRCSKSKSWSMFLSEKSVNFSGTCSETGASRALFLTPTPVSQARHHQTSATPSPRSRAAAGDMSIARTSSRRTAALASTGGHADLAWYYFHKTIVCLVRVLRICLLGGILIALVLPAFDGARASAWLAPPGKGQIITTAVFSDSTRYFDASGRASIPDSGLCEILAWLLSRIWLERRIHACRAPFFR